MDALRRARSDVAALALVTAAGTVGYLLLGFSPLNAALPDGDHDLDGRVRRGRADVDAAAGSSRSC